MKKIKLNKGLNLSKKSITKLQESQLSNFKGGNKGLSDYSCANGSCIKSCNEDSCTQVIR